MEEAKRWTVTYTKQMNKKAKVYHDGFLELNSLRKKVILYDDCQNILDSRFIKKDDLIESGETLRFDSYLVDIGDLQGDAKFSAKVNVPLKGKGVTRTPESFQSPIIDRKPILGKQKARSGNQSPSHKIIREFKRSEMSKNSCSPASLDTTESSKREWQVLYTTQITQKAKKYQDGYLQLLICGSKGNQMMLYDATRRLLDSRFVKKDEVIRSGESVAFDGHLVDIGEGKEDHEPPKKLNCQGTEHIRSIKVEAADDHIHSPKESPVEWEVMYTTELTKKTKKYNSGTLKLVASGSYHNQVTLLSEEGTMLSRKFLQSSEKLGEGNTLRVQNYLVELGESRACPKEIRNTGSSLTVKDSSVRCSYEKNIASSTRVQTNGPARGALEILSILRKPVQKDVPEKERQIQEGFFVSQPGQPYPSGTRNKVKLECEQSICHEGRAKANVNEEITEVSYQENTSKKFEAVQVPVIEISKPENGQIGSSDFCDRSGCIFEMGTGIDSVTSSGLSGTEPKIGELEVQQKTTPMIEVSSTAVRQMGVCSEPISCTDGSQIDARWGRGNKLTDMTTSNEQNINKKDADAFPSFDLGF